MVCSKCLETTTVLNLLFLCHRNRRAIKRDPRRLSKLCNEPSSKSFENILENIFPDHECPWEKQILLPTKTPLLFSSKYSKFGFSPENRFNRFWDCSPAISALTCLTVRAVRKVAADIFFKTGLAEFFPYSAGFETGRVSGWVAQWTGIPLVETGSTGLKTGSTGFCSFSPNGCQLLGDPLYTPSHSLSHLLLPLPRILGW
jgi:hypothetical protein